MNTLTLFIDIPFSGFRPVWSREYQDTYPVPPPSTIYNMLLSLIGIDWNKKDKYRGIQIALAIQGEREPEIAHIFRKFRRIPQSGKKEPDPYTSRRPDFQDLLLWLKCWIWIKDFAKDDSFTTLIKDALTPSTRGKINRYGGLSLGESSHLINEISLMEPSDNGRYLIIDPDGYLTLPVWVHHERCPNDQTVLKRFKLSDPTRLSINPPENAWIEIKY